MFDWGAYQCYTNSPFSEVKEEKIDLYSFICFEQPLSKCHSTFDIVKHSSSFLWFSVREMFASFSYEDAFHCHPKLCMLYFLIFGIFWIFLILILVMFFYSGSKGSSILYVIYFHIDRRLEWTKIFFYYCVVCHDLWNFIFYEQTMSYLCQNMIFFSSSALRARFSYFCHLLHHHLASSVSSCVPATFQIE